MTWTSTKLRNLMYSRNLDMEIERSSEITWKSNLNYSIRVELFKKWRWMKRSYRNLMLRKLFSYPKSERCKQFPNYQYRRRSRKVQKRLRNIKTRSSNKLSKKASMPFPLAQNPKKSSSSAMKMKIYLNTYHMNLKKRWKKKLHKTYQIRINYFHKRPD